LYTEIPLKLKNKINLPPKDKGIDGIAIDNNDKIFALQDKFRNELANFLNSEFYIFDVDIGKCAITLNHQINNIHFDVVFYNMSKKYGQEVYYDRQLHKDEKKEEMINIKKHLTGDKNKTLKKIICFLKFLYKSIQVEKDRNIPSIAIVELVIQNYGKKLEKSCSQTLLKILINSLEKLNKKFALLTSNKTKENLFDNKRRTIKKIH
jgi:hypothetical protein